MYLLDFSSYTYAYDELGRRKSVVNGGSQFDPAELSLWGYNRRSELESSHRHEGDDPDQPGTEITPERRLYSYDHIGNRLESTEGTSTVSYYCPTDVNQYKYVGPTQPTCTSVTPTHLYDDDGNMIDDGVLTYRWDAENRLIAVQTKRTGDPVDGDKLVEFKYDYMGRRVEKTYSLRSGSSWIVQPGYPQRFVYDGCNVVMVLQGTSNTVKAKYTWGLDLSGSIHGAGGIGGLLAAVETQGTAVETDDQRYWFFYDANGNVGQVLDATNTGNITIAAHYEYDPYGNVIGPDPDGDGDWQEHASAFTLANPIRFSTKWFDDETGLGYWGQRYYDPRTGRWTSQDPIEDDGGLNLYAMLGNRVLDLFDPDGMAATQPAAVPYELGESAADVQKAHITHFEDCGAWVLEPGRLTPRML